MLDNLEHLASIDGLVTELLVGETTAITRQPWLQLRAPSISLSNAAQPR
jgi:hypothetical protein